MSIMIGGMSFASREQAKAFCRAMLARYEAPEMVIANDAYFLCDLIALHPDANGKIGVGINHFEVRLKRYGAPCFNVVRLDGSVEEFSYKKCLGPRAG